MSAEMGTEGLAGVLEKLVLNDKHLGLADALSMDKELRDGFWAELVKNTASAMNTINKNDPEYRQLGDLLLGLEPDMSKDVYPAIVDDACKQLVRITKYESVKDSPRKEQIKAKEQNAKYLQLIMKVLSKDGDTLVLDTSISSIVASVAPYLDRRLDRVGVVAPAVIIISKCLLSNQDMTINALQDVLDVLIAQDSLDTLITAFSIVTVVFHMDSLAGGTVFAMEEIQHQQFSRRHFLSEELVIAALESLSAACVDKQSRMLVAGNFEAVVKTALESDKQAVKLLAASILVKTKASSETNDKEDTKLLLQLSDIFEQAVADHVVGSSTDGFYSVALEGLAYTSLLTDVRELIIKNENLVNNLVKTLENYTTDAPVIYSTLGILSNLTQYSPRLSEEQQRISELKNYAGKSSLDNKEREPDSHVAARCQKIVKASLVGVISKVTHKLTPTSKATIASILKNLVTDKSHRQTFVKEGGLAVAIYLLLPPDKDKNMVELDDQARNRTSSALAKTLISVDPSIAFSGKISLLVTVPLLLNQLNNEYAEMPLLDSFEALLALTNIAAIDEKCRDNIMIKGWSVIENLWTSNNHMIQRASVELICNLALSPFCAEKFLDGSKPATSRLEMLAIFTDVDYLPTQRAAAGALAVLSEWDPAAAVMSKCNKLIQKLHLILQDSEDDDLILRAVTALANIINGEGSDTTIFEEAGTADLLKKMAASTKEDDIKQAVLEALAGLER